MTGEAKPEKHTAKEIAATTNRGVGKAEVVVKAGGGKAEVVVVKAGGGKAEVVVVKAGGGKAEVVVVKAGGGKAEVVVVKAGGDKACRERGGHAATTNRGGGRAGGGHKAGQGWACGERGGDAKLECPHYKITKPDVKSMQIHHNASHPKVPFDESKLKNLHARNVAEPSKTKTGVRGRLKK